MRGFETVLQWAQNNLQNMFDTYVFIWIIVKSNNYHTINVSQQYIIVYFTAFIILCIQIDVQPHKDASGKLLA